MIFKMNPEKGERYKIYRKMLKDYKAAIGRNEDVSPYGDSIFQFGYCHYLKETYGYPIDWHEPKVVLPELYEEYLITVNVPQVYFFPMGDMVNRVKLLETLLKKKVKYV